MTIDKNLFSGIREASQSIKRSEVKSRTLHEKFIDELARTDPAYGLGLEWSDALDNMAAGGVDPREVDDEFTQKVDALAATGNDSQILAMIKQQLPNIDDIGRVAAYKADFESLLNNATESLENKHEDDEPDNDSDDDGSTEDTDAESDSTLVDNPDNDNPDIPDYVEPLIGDELVNDEPHESISEDISTRYTGAVRRTVLNEGYDSLKSK